MNKIIKRILLFSILIYPVFKIDAQIGPKLAKKLRQNVVAIESIFKNKVITNNGFGFIIGEKNDELYVVTANHVVEKYDEEENKYIKAYKINVRFSDFEISTISCNSQSIIKQERGSVDIAILKIEKPWTYFWKRRCIDPKLGKNSEAYFIGKSGTWDITNAPGKIAKLDSENRYFVEDLNVMKGSSGTPLLGKKGIVVGVNNKKEAKSIYSYYDTYRIPGSVFYPYKGYSRTDLLNKANAQNNLGTVFLVGGGIVLIGTITWWVFKLLSQETNDKAIRNLSFTAKLGYNERYKKITTKGFHFVYSF